MDSDHNNQQTSNQKLTNALEKWEKPANLIASAIFDAGNSVPLRSSYIFGAMAVLGATGITWASNTIDLGAITLVMMPFLIFAAIGLKKEFYHEQKNPSESTDSD